MGVSPRVSTKKKYVIRLSAYQKRLLINLSTKQVIWEMRVGRESHAVVFLVYCWRASRYGIDGHYRNLCYGEIKD